MREISPDSLRSPPWSDWEPSSIIHTHVSRQLFQITKTPEYKWWKFQRGTQAWCFQEDYCLLWWVRVFKPLGSTRTIWPLGQHLAGWNLRVSLCIYQCSCQWLLGLVCNGIVFDLSLQRLARTINHLDERFKPPVPQVVFYQSGIGSEKNLYSEYVEGTANSLILPFVSNHQITWLLSLRNNGKFFRSVVGYNSVMRTLMFEYKIADKVEEAYGFIAQ